MTKTHSGWVTFAGVMLFILGVLNVIYGIAAIGDSKFFIQDQKYILSNLNTWGWVTLILGALQLFAAFSLWSGGLYGRFVAILAATLSALAALLSIPRTRSGRWRSSPSTSSSSIRSRCTAAPATRTSRARRGPRRRAGTSRPREAWSRNALLPGLWVARHGVEFD